jgi:hypothetical protein
MIVNDYNQVADGADTSIKDRSAVTDIGHEYLNAPIIIEKWPRIIRWAFMIGAAASLWTALVAIFYLV